MTAAEEGGKHQDMAYRSGRVIKNALYYSKPGAIHNGSRYQS